jgi:uncharacterized protein involved in outer membrane biogenesis
MKKPLIAFLIFVALIFAANKLLEPLALRYVNKALDDVEGYQGSIGDVDINLWRGSYQIQQLRFDRYQQNMSTPLVYIETVDISVEWSALFDGSVVGEIILKQPELTFTVSESEHQPIQAGQENNWTETIKALVPLKLNRFEVVQGVIRYQDPYAEPAVEIVLRTVQGLVTNLSNAEDLENPLPTEMEMEADAMGGSQLLLNGRINVLKKYPDFEMKAELSTLDLQALNELADAYGNFTFKAGTLYLASEASMRDGRYEGYIKPVLENVEIVDLTNDDSGLLRKLWELVVGGAMQGLENQSADRFATKVPFSGDLEGGSVATWTSIKNVLKNAFVEAYKKQID